MQLGEPRRQNTVLCRKILEWMAISHCTLSRTREDTVISYLGVIFEEFLQTVPQAGMNDGVDVRSLTDSIPLHEPVCGNAAYYTM